MARTRSCTSSASHANTPCSSPIATELGCPNAVIPRSIDAYVSMSNFPCASSYSRNTSALETNIPGGSVFANGVNCTNCASKMVAGTPRPDASIGTSANAFPHVPYCGARSLCPPVCNAKTRFSRHASPNHVLSSRATPIVAPPDPTRGPGGSVITTYRSRSLGSAPAS